jgi:hypothetical protein
VKLDTDGVYDTRGHFPHGDEENHAIGAMGVVCSAPLGRSVSMGFADSQKHLKVKHPGRWGRPFPTFLEADSRLIRASWGPAAEVAWLGEETPSRDPIVHFLPKSIRI